MNLQTYATEKMLHDFLAQQIEEELGFTFTSEQSNAALDMARFMLCRDCQPTFILRGYAGTGKTSLVGALVRVMQKLERPVQLLAPTGRAAKVFSMHSGVAAHTIHKAIYRQESFRGEDTHFSLGFNKQPGTLFIVDEASMLSNQGGGTSIFGTGLLLDDLLHFVFSTEGCRLMLVGDTAQLPPVGEEESPALSAEVLRGYGLSVFEASLTQVVRQREESSVLTGATLLRSALQEQQNTLPRLAGSKDGEVSFLPGDELIEALVTAYSDYGQNDTIVITRSNKRANIYNAGIRARVFDREERLSRGDVVMAVKNNYYWTEQLRKNLSAEEKLPLDFIANGDIAEVISVRNFHEEHGFQFADALLRFPDYDNQEISCRVLLDTLQSESPSLTAEESSRLYESVLQDYMHIPSKAERMKQLREDQYYNALQLKYAYAVTCHKAQGGQWGCVFIDQGYIPPEMSIGGYLRWLYTAYTRTYDKLYLINWPKEQRTEEEE